MEIENEIVKTRKRIEILEQQNEKFKALLNKAVTVAQNASACTLFERDFMQESLAVIEEEQERLKEDLTDLDDEIVGPIKDLYHKVYHLEKLCKTQQHHIELLKGEHAEIKFLLLHPESRNSDWLKTILNLENEAVSPTETSLIEEHLRLQQKILNLENKKAELLIAINDVSIPEDLGSFVINDLRKSFPYDNSLDEYEDLRFKMLRLEDERSRLLSELQCVLDHSRKQIAEEYSNLQEKIVAVERQKASLRLNIVDPRDVKVTNSELQSIFGAFRNLSLSEAEEIERVKRIQTELGGRFCPGFNLPMYCTIL